MNDQQTTAVQAGINFTILFCSCTSLVLIAGVCSFQIAAGIEMTWIDWAFPVLNVILIACLLTGFNCQISEAASFALKTVVYPSLAFIAVGFSLGIMYSTSKGIQQSEIHLAYLKGNSEAYKRATKDLGVLHQDCIKGIQKFDELGEEL